MINGRKITDFLNKNKTELKIKNQKLTSQQLIETVIPFLEQHKNISFLDLSPEGVGVHRSNRIGDEGFEALMRADTGVTKLDVTYNQITNKGFNSLKCNKNIIDLTMDLNLVDGTEFEGLEGTNLLKLSLSLCPYDRQKIRREREGMNNANAIKLANILLTTPIKVLDVSYHSIGDEGAGALAALSTLEELNLGNNLIQVQGAKAIFSCPHLKKIDLNNNNIGDEGVEALKENQTLEVLKVKNAGISDVGARIILSHPKINELDINCNKITAEGVNYIDLNTSLKKLSIAYNKLKTAGGKKVLTSPSIEKLDMSANKISDENFNHFQISPTIKELNMSYNRFGDEGAKSIFQHSQIEIVNLASNKLKTLPGIETNPYLLKINLSGNYLNDEDVLKLANHPTLNYIRVNYPVGKEINTAKMFAANAKFTVISTSQQALAKKHQYKNCKLVVLDAVDYLDKIIAEKDATKRLQFGYETGMVSSLKNISLFNVGAYIEQQKISGSIDDQPLPLELKADLKRIYK